jgi:hypothetical protein
MRFQVRHLLLCYCNLIEVGDSHTHAD